MKSQITFIVLIAIVLFIFNSPSYGMDMNWVYINDPGVSGHEDFNGYMSKYETTNAQFAQFLNEAKASGDIVLNGGIIQGENGSNPGEDYLGQNYYRLDEQPYQYDGATTEPRISFSDGFFSVIDGFENHPVSHVSWYGAMAFCHYYGYQLPTQWEWQAVADYDGSYTYGCGTSINNNNANYMGSTHPYGTTAIGTFKTYGYGMADMAGNVWEWTRTAYGNMFILCGGGWGSQGNHCAFSYLYLEYPNDLSLTVMGFRVVKHVPDINSNLIGYWSFDDGSNVTAFDYSGNGNDGTIYGAEPTAGISGNALYFDGIDDYISLGTNTFNWDLRSQPITITAWIKLTGLKTANIILSKEQLSHPFHGWELTYEMYDNKRLNACILDSNNKGMQSKVVNLNLNINQWYHVAMTYDGSGSAEGISFWLNNTDLLETIGKNDANWGTSENPYDCQIGAREQGNNFCGHMDELRVYNRALSSSEISYLYNLHNNTKPEILSTIIKTKSVIPNDGSDFSIIRTTLSNIEGLSDIQQVTIDLSDLGGNFSQPMYDDGKTSGDMIARDGIYCYKLQVNNSSITGMRSFQITAIDQAGNVASGSDSISVNAMLEFNGEYERTLGIMNVKSESAFVQTAPNQWSSSGRIQINGFLNLDGEIYIDAGLMTVSGSGKFNIQNIPLMGTVEIYEGDFQFDAFEGKTKKLDENDENSEIDIESLPVSVSHFYLLSDGVSIGGKIHLPKELGSISAEISDLRITQSEGFDIETTVSLGSKVKIPGTSWGLENATLTIDTISPTLYQLDATLDAGVVTVQGDITFDEDYFGLGVDVSGLNIPIDSTPLVLHRLGGGFTYMYGMGFEGVEINANAGISLPSGIPGTRVFDLDGEVDIGLSGYFRGKVTVTLFIVDDKFDGYEIGSLEVKIGAKGTKYEGFSAEGNIHIIIVKFLEIDGTGSFKVDLAGNFQGKANASIGIVEDVKWVGGMQFANAAVYFDNNNFAGKLSVSKLFEVGFRVDNKGDWHCPTNVDEYVNSQQMIMSSGFGIMAASTAGTYIPEGMETAILRMTWDTAPEGFYFTIVDPSLTDYTPDDAPLNSEIINYVSIPDAQEAYYVIANPQAGYWEAQYDDAGVVNPEFSLMGVNNGPTLQMTAPAVDEIGQTSYTLEWSAYDTDDVAKISLYYDKDQTGADGALIVADIDENDGLGGYVWTPEDIPSSQYYIYGVINDGKNPPMVSYSTGTISFTNPYEPDAPTGLTGLTGNRRIYLSWNESPESDIAGYKVYYTLNLSSPDFDNLVDVGNATSYDLTNLINNTPYRAAISAYSDTDHESVLSDSILRTPIKIDNNQIPTITSVALFEAIEGIEYQYQVTAVDPEGLPIIYTLLEFPEGMNIDSKSGLVTWTPKYNQVDSQPVTVLVRDDATEFSLQSFTIAVKGDLDFDGIPDDIDDDRDGDGILNVSDTYPDDYDNDGDPDETDPDDDNDGLLDSDERLYGSNVHKQDTDDDGILDNLDNCKTTYNPSQSDMDGDGTGDKCDCLPDLTNSNGVNMEDFALFARNWDMFPCTPPDYCYATDFNKSGVVDIEDLIILIDHWLGNINKIHILGDFNDNGIVDLRDFSIVAYYWMKLDCGLYNNCEGSDTEPDGDVDINDLMFLTENWLKKQHKQAYSNRTDRNIPTGSLRV